ncbi:hypothetical protein L596_016454 [Steinernema carpocapsae]|uniref:Uncharacterized protein n=1 Tax=Steinernema carpocapsae TaxID=34508 RepID=A0A4V6A3G2_STECR|nr:hypothetical protein L596_016454 [Steinernema carpocapsae]
MVLIMILIIFRFAALVVAVAFFGWNLESSTYGKMQTAYLVVYSSMSIIISVFLLPILKYFASVVWRCANYLDEQGISKEDKQDQKQQFEEDIGCARTTYI